MCVCVWGVVFYYIILLGEADKTHLIVLCYYVTKTGLVGAAALFPTFHTYLGDKATDCTSLVSGCSHHYFIGHSILVRYFHTN